jgi:hypothetical protein
MTERQQQFLEELKSKGEIWFSTYDVPLYSILNPLRKRKLIVVEYGKLLEEFPDIDHWRVTLPPGGNRSN